MSMILWLLILIGAALALAWRPARLSTAYVVMGTLLAIFSLAGPSAGLFKVLLWVTYAAACCVWLLPDFRREHLLKPIIRYARAQLPTLSDTERVAIDAGTVSWEAELFAGRPNWHKLLGVRTPELSPAELAFLDGPVEKFCNMLKDWEISHELADLPPRAWQHLKKHGFFGLEIPQKFGGLGFSAGAHAAILRKIASTPAGMTASSIVAVPNSLGPAALLLKYGTPEQQSRYLPGLASGEEIPCFALTSPVAGSDAGAIQDTGVICVGVWQGQTVTGINLNWDKRYITLAPVATVIGLAVRLSDPQGLIGKPGERGISCCLIPATVPGVEIGKRHLPLNAPFMNGPTRGKDVFVPLDALIGGPAMAGQGWRMLTECLSTGRAISLPAGSSGILQGVARNTGAYARIREQFGRPIGEFEGVAEALARIGGYAYAATAVSRMAAGAVDCGERPSVASAIAKYHCTDMMRKGVSDAMDVHGGKGVMLGPNNWLGRIWQSAPVHITVEGANILTRSMMIYGQGAMRAHPYLRQEVEALQAQDDLAFEGLLAQHLGQVYSAGCRAFVHGLSGSRLAQAPASPVRSHYQQIERYSAAFSLVSDVCLVSIGPQLKQRESLSGRLADVLSWLYIASASLKQFEEGGRANTQQPLIDWVCALAFQNIETALDGVIRQLPYRVLRWKLYAVVFPLGRRARGPADETAFAVANLLQTPGADRDLLTQAAWVSKHESQPTGRLELALQSQLDTLSLQRRLQRAVQDGQIEALSAANRIEEAEASGIVNADEARALRTWARRVAEVVAVDEFTSAALARTRKKLVPRRRAASPTTAS